MLTVVWNRLIIDLTDDSEATRAIRRRAHRLAILLVVAAIITLMMKLAALPFGFFLVATFLAYLADVPGGNAAAVRGMIVGGLSVALWGGWGCAWTTATFDLPLGLAGAAAGALAGGMFGALLGVFLGWLARSARSLAPTPRGPTLKVGPELRDAWIDERA